MKSVLRILEGFPSSPVVKNPPCNAGDTSLIHDPGSYYMKQGNWACAAQLLSLCSGAWKKTTREAQQEKSTRRAQEKPWQWEANAPQLEDSLRLVQLEKPPRSNEDPVLPKINIKKEAEI